MVQIKKVAWKGYLILGALTLLAYILHPAIQLQSMMLVGADFMAVLAMLAGLWFFPLQSRAAWLFFITAQCLNTLGDILFINQVYFASAVAADWFFNIIYILGSLNYVIGLILFFISFRRLIQRDTLINGLILATALFCVIWTVQIYPTPPGSMDLEKWIETVIYSACLLIVGVMSSVFLMTTVGGVWSYRFLYLAVMFYGVGLFFYNTLNAVLPLTAQLRDGWLPLYFNAAYSTAYFFLGAAFLHPSFQHLDRAFLARNGSISRQNLVVLGLSFLACPLVYWLQRWRGVDVDAGFILVSVSIIFGLVEARLAQLVWALESQNRLMGSQQAQLQYQASHDALTNLPNRASLDQYLVDLASRMPADGTFSALFMIDLDRFKMVNDTFGHSQGDIVLLQVADRLLKVKRKQDMVARWGGDEFVYVVENLSSYDDAQAFASRICRDVRVTTGVGESRVEVTLSLGGCLFREGDDVHAVLKRADIALYHAKSFRDDEKISIFPQGPDEEAVL